MVKGRVELMGPPRSRLHVDHAMHGGRITGGRGASSRAAVGFECEITLLTCGGPWAGAQIGTSFREPIGHLQVQR
jgi:phosphoribosylglycinamide formyltransferase 2